MYPFYVQASFNRYLDYFIAQLDHVSGLFTAHETSLPKPLFIKDPVPNQEVSGYVHYGY